MQLEGLRFRGWMMMVVAVSGVAAGCTDTKTVGLVSARDRAQPLTPATRAQLESQGAVCTPNPAGPVLCTWTNGSTTCDLTFDQNDLLTRLSCTVDGLGFTCTRPSSLFVCSWSDEPGCGDVYDASGAFIGYLCGQELQDRIHPDAGVTPEPDAGQTTDRDGGSSTGCQNLSEDQCVRDQGASCRPLYCAECEPSPNNGRYVGCFGPNDPIPDCPRPTQCPTDCTQLDEQTCSANPACHGVYLDRQQCGCPTAGCCTFFDHCANGAADCDQSHAQCDRVPPVCEAPYAVGVSGGCYEGCVLASACPATPPPPAEIQCDAQPPVFPRFENACQSEQDCAVGIRQADCCGTDVAVGIHPADARLFEEDARICLAQFPVCRCADRGIQTDDGQLAIDPTHVVVSCQQGVCVTATRP